MKLKKAFSVCLILLVLLSSIGYHESEPLKISSGQPCTGAQLSVESDEEFQEYRHTIKISISGNVKPRSFHSVHSLSLLGFQVIHHAKYGAYLMQTPPVKSSGRLFLQLGALII